MSTDKIDHVIAGLDRLSIQYKESINLKSFITGLLQPALELEQVMNDLLLLRWLDTASGDNLDILGDILGQPRTIFDITGLEFFGFDTAINSGTFGDETDSTVGSRFRSEEEATTGKVTFADPEYRTILKSVALSNKTDCTIDNIESITSVLFEARVQTTLTSPLEATIRIYKPLDTTERSLAAVLISRPNGVIYTYEDDNGVFA